MDRESARKLYREMSAFQLIERYIFFTQDDVGDLEAELKKRELFDLAHNLYEDAVAMVREQVEKTNEIIADLDAIPGLKKQAWDSWNQLVDTGTIRSAIESPCRHRWVIVNVGGPLVCERCGKAMPELP